MPKRLSFQITRLNLGDYVGGSLGWFIITEAGLAAADGGLEYVADLAVDYEIDGAPRGTIDVVLDEVEGSSTRSLLVRDPESTIPVADTTGTTPAMVVFYDTTGADDTEHKLVAALEVTVIEAGYADWEIDPSDGIAAITSASDLDSRTVAGVAAVGNDYDAESVADAVAPFLPTGLTVDVLIEDIDLAGGSFTHVTPYGSPDPVPRAYFTGLTALAVTGSDIGYLWTLTATGACTQGRALAPGDVVSAGYFQGQTAVAVGTSAVTGIFVQATEDYVEAAAVAGAAGATDRAVALSQIVGDQTYLKVGHDGTGSPSHDEGAFSCGTDLNFTTGVDVRVWGRLMRTAGTDSFPEWITQNVDGGANAYKLAPFQDEDDVLVWFAEHIKTGETEGQNPRLLSAQGLPQNPALGVLVGIRHTIDFTGGPGGVGVEKFWVPSDDPDVVTADGIGWKTIATLTHAGPESIETSYAERFYLGLSEHESHLFVVQMFNGIDGTCLVDLHAADATSATTITCRQGTVWTAAGSQAEIVNYGSGGGSFDLPAEIHAATGKTTPVDADEFPMSDSAASWGLKKLTWANLKATAKAYFDTLYMALVAGSNDDFLQRKAGAWTSRTPAQVKADLAIAAYPSSHAILPAVQRPASYVTWTPAVSAVLAGGYASGANTVGSETWTYPVACRAGTWRADVVIRKTPASGIITATFGGSALGTADCYNATNSGDNNTALSTSFTVAADGTYDLVLTNPTKHGTSIGYVWHIQVINLTRTGP